MIRYILHVDMDAFFAAVEQRDHPELRGKPLVVGAGPHERGVVSTASYEARKFGIHSAMPSREAYRRCPHAVFVRGNHARYAEVSRQIFAIFERYTPFVEGLSCDEAFLDVTGSQKLFGTAEDIARRIRADIQNELQLTASIGVATNKFLAKIASDVNKPDGLTIVPTAPDEIRAFLAPMSVGRIFGIGKKSIEPLHRAGIRTIGDVQKAHPGTITRLLGATAGTQLVNLANGIDDRLVVTEHEEKSISREYTFPEDCDDRERIVSVLLDLASDVGRRIRAAGKYAGTGKLKLRHHDFSTVTRQQPFAAPTCDDFTFRETALALFNALEPVRSVRLIGFGVTGLTTDPAPAAALFKTHEDLLREKRERVCKSLDDIRRRLDGGKITFGSAADDEHIPDDSMER